MKQQVIRIHWWESKANYKDFSDYLEKLEYKPFEEKKKKWGLTFKEDLGDNYEVFMPIMPNKNCADYEHWKIMFEKVFKFLKDDVILVWHSMWVSFLCKYLEENTFPVSIKKIFLISWAFDDIEWDVIWNFRFNQNLDNLKKYEEKIILYHSKDDLVVSFSHFENFRKLLPNSEYKIFEDRFHFIDETFPELIKDIKKV